MMAYHFYYKVTVTELFEFVLAARGAEAGAVEGPHPVPRAEDDKLSYLFFQCSSNFSSAALESVLQMLNRNLFTTIFSQFIYYCRVRHTSGRRDLVKKSISYVQNAGSTVHRLFLDLPERYKIN
jgi:hypothetical protein